ncbi:MAG: hypothetical protein JSV26_04315 [bacterium]|nr:MAG: hypothetical protein JSV26_04315 [bacterium]
MRLLDIDNRTRIAFHEAGHAFMLRHLGLAVDWVSLTSPEENSGGRPGRTQPKNELPWRRPDLSEKYALFSLAGPAAEYHLVNQWDNEGLREAHRDETMARRFIQVGGRDMPDHKMDSYIKSLKDTAMDMVSRPANWNRITVLAYALMEVDRMSGTEVNEILDED